MYQAWSAPFKSLHPHDHAFHLILAFEAIETFYLYMGDLVGNVFIINFVVCLILKIYNLKSCICVVHRFCLFYFHFGVIHANLIRDKDNTLSLCLSVQLICITCVTILRLGDD